MAQANLQTEWSSYFVKGQWRYIRSTFLLAGQDSFTTPPAQNPDLFELLTNVLPPNQQTLQRRWGYTFLNTLNVATLNNSVVPATLYYNFTLNNRRVVWPVGNTLQATNEDGTTFNPLIFTSVAQPVRMCSSRSFGYFASGAAADLLKWDGSAITNGVSTNSMGVSKWGIDVNDVVAGTNIFGPSAPGTAADIPATGPPWTNIAAIKTSGVVFATAALTLSSSDQFIDSGQGAGTNFGFSIAQNDTIEGIQVSLNGDVTLSGALGHGGFVVLNVQLLKNSNPVGVVKQVTLPANTAGIVTLGSSNDLWGATWLASDIANASFGVQIQAAMHSGGISSSVTSTTSVNSLQVQVWSSANGIELSPPVSGSITLISGRIYFYVFHNSYTGHYSDLSGPSNSTGPLTLQNQPIFDIGVSLDPQVDSVVVLATSDGGDETLLYFVTSLPNGTTTYTDNTPDTILVTNQVYFETDAFGDEIGVADNTPPPQTLLYPTPHRGRIYGAAVQNLFFSKAESELLTSTGLLAGKYEEAWPGLNYFTITTGADVITGLLTDGTVLYVGTTRKVVRLFGDGPSNFTEPEVLFNDVGVLNQDVWRMVFAQGNPLGAMWITPDYRVLGSDFNTYVNVGLPIQNILNSINTQVAAAVSWSAYVALGTYNLYLLAVPTGTNTQPDTVLCFDLNGRQWYTWLLTDLCLGGVWNITQPGQPITYFLASTGAMYQLDENQTQDRVGNGPVNFTATMRTGFLGIVDPSARLYMNEIEVATGDPALTVTVEGASTTAEFLGATNPVVTNAPLVTKPRGELAVFMAGAPCKDRFYRFTFTSPGNAVDLLRLVSMEGGVLHRI
jgi:hypothetical protein